MDARTKWDTRYAGDSYRMGDGPKRFLRLLAEEGLIPGAGRALDVAAGEGQTAVFLAQHGLDVDAWDISAVGLAKADRLAAQQGVADRVHTQVVDLEGIAKATAPLGRAVYHLITCVHYKQAGLASAMVEALAPNGLVAIEILGEANLQVHPHPSRRFLVADEEVAGWFRQLEPVIASAGWEDDRYAVRFVGRKR